MEWSEEWILARLGGSVLRHDSKPGNQTLGRGLRRLMEMLTTKAVLTAYWTEQGGFPPKIAAFLRG